MEEGLGFDLYNRDPNDINSDLQVRWNDLVAEPDDIRSANCIWRTSYKLFNSSNSCCYNLLTAIFFVPISICVGCRFACVSFQHIWCVRPCLHDLKINCHALRTMMTMCCDSIVGPFFEAVGLVFSRFKFVLVSEKHMKKVFTGANPCNPKVIITTCKHYFNLLARPMLMFACFIGRIKIIAISCNFLLFNVGNTVIMQRLLFLHHKQLANHHFGK